MNFYLSCALVGIRTPNLLIRSEMLYPVELRNHCPFGTAKVEIVFKNRNIHSKKNIEAESSKKLSASFTSTCFYFLN